MVQTRALPHEPPRDGTPGPRNLERKRQILRAAAREFRRRGFHDTGMRDIAASSGMQVGNLYYYFESKQALLAFCQEETLTRLLTLGAWVEGQDLRSDSRLYLLLVEHVCALNDENPGALAHLEVEFLEEPHRTRLKEGRDRYEGILRTIIQRGRHEDVLQTSDVRITARTLLGAVNWTARWYRPDGAMSARRIGELQAEQLVRGLLRPGEELRIPDTTVPRDLPRVFRGGPGEEREVK